MFTTKIQYKTDSVKLSWETQDHPSLAAAKRYVQEECKWENTVKGFVWKDGVMHFALDGDFSK